ncbi:hypothetical protein OUY22_27335 [Nonomuraea sp. MCN248]|uniref:CBM2 domain-containing protein n=1 Tax=Nonomuraea corallina TaxID=2989783 RepID=A0ABT4SIT3_9ACTN|nr:hypothetical protein [Nonomuraea corallina]MDA0637134.1 hypothetical protein [Nonomuraea corallina]
MAANCNRQKGLCMGRHGTGGSEDANDRGDSAFWGPDNQQSDSFWDKDDRPEPPGWPSLPDQPEVTGQWAPMPKRDTPATGHRSDPFETTGAFAASPRPGADHGRPRDDQPFETTGAFARPQSWDDAPDGPPQGRLPGEGPKPGHGPADPHGAFRPPAGDPFADAHDPFRSQQSDPHDPFGSPQSDPHDPFRSQRSDPFGQADPHDPFGQGDPHGAFRPPRDDPFGGDTQGLPREQGDPFGQEATGRFDVPGLPPEPGDVKVAGEPTMIARTPAWAEAETGFLGPDRSGEEQGRPEPRRGRGRRKPSDDPDDLDDLDGLDSRSGGRSRGRGRLALLSVAAVAVVLGGTVIGVKMLSGGDEACPGGRCAAVQASNQPGPQVSEPVEEETEPVEEEETPDEEATEEAQPEPTRSDTGSPAPRRTSAPTARPSKTRSASPVEDEPVDEQTVEEVTDDEVTDEPSESPWPDDVGNGTIPTQGVPQPDPTPTTEAPSRSRPLSGGAATVNVRFNVDRQRVADYTATMSVTNDSPRTLDSFTVSMPVRGKILDVRDVEWTQDGNLLIVDITTPIAAGDSAELTISATGRAGTPKNCGLVGGDCTIA